MEQRTLIERTRKVKRKNLLHPGFSECSRCGGNWGWKKDKRHNTSPHNALFLFCVDCDKVVTIEERWKALDWWKAECIRQSFVYNRQCSLKGIIKEIRDIEVREFVEFPRKQNV
jgi:hypothetical protein